MKSIMIGMMLCATVEAAALPAAAAETAHSKDILTASEIREVTVYNYGAKIRRVAEVNIPAGAHNIVFSGLPAALGQDSLRAEAVADGDVRLGALVSRQVMSADLAAPREKELNDRLEALQDQLALIDAEKSALDARKAFLASLGQQTAASVNETFARADIKPDQWMGASQAIYAGMAETLKASAQQDVKLRDLNREIEKTKKQLDEVHTSQYSSWTVEVPLETKAATHAAIAISYQVVNAGWKPLYDARLDGRGTGSLVLTQYGDVQQTTGEDWSNVAMTLSTAQPQRSASQPDLQAMWVDRHDGRVVVQQLVMDSVDCFDGGGPCGGGGAMVSPNKQSVQEETADYNRKAAIHVTAELKATKFMSEYKIPGPATVLSDGSNTKLMVGDFDTDSILEVHVKPQLSTDAYLVAKTKLKGDAPIMTGQVSLFRDGAFIGNSTLPMLRPGEETALYFGIDDQVSVTRNTLKDERKQAGVLAQDSVLERDFVTGVQNLHKSPVDVVVRETVPAARDAKVAVDIAREATTPGYEADANHVNGQTQWSFSLQPQEKKELKLGWTVSWPSSDTLTGVPGL